ncbi:hypothetical protein K3M35_04990 [Rhodococcus sp. DMU2021]|nr:hypothetical protein [Rhodococcus sp. DMU2021]
MLTEPRIEPDPEREGRAVLWRHECNGAVVDGALPVGPGGWNYDPAADTLSPSIWCHTCDTHGFWVSGRWRAA